MRQASWRKLAVFIILTNLPRFILSAPDVYKESGSESPLKLEDEDERITPKLKLDYNYQEGTVTPWSEIGKNESDESLEPIGRPWTEINYQNSSSPNETETSSKMPNEYQESSSLISTLEPIGRPSTDMNYQNASTPNETQTSSKMPKEYQESSLLISTFELSNTTDTWWEGNVTVEVFTRPFPPPPLIYNNSGFVNDTKDGWIATLYDESETPCLLMNLQIVIIVYFGKPDSSASFVQNLPTSPSDLKVEGQCGEDSSLVWMSWESANLTWHFDREKPYTENENGTWSLNDLELSVTNEWFEFHQFCEPPCYPFEFKSSGSWSYNSSTSCKQVNVPLSNDKEDLLKAMVILMGNFHVQPFVVNGSDFETNVC